MPLSKWKWWLIVLAVVLVLGASMINKIQGQSNLKNVNAGVQSVKAAQAEMVIRQNNLNVSGTIDAVEKILISARVAGIVESLNVDNGASIRAGQVLIQIDDRAYANLVEVNQASLIQAQTQLESTRTTYERLKQLHQAGAASDKDFEDIQAALTAAEADVSKAQAALNNSRDDLKNTRVSSPIDGLAANRSVNRGQMVSPGTALMEVQNLAEVYVIISISQSDLGQIKTGMEADVTVDAYPGQTLKGVLTSVNPAADPQARIFQCKIKVPNPDGILRSGMFASAVIHTGEATSILCVPEAALTSKQEQFYVFVPQDNTAKLVAVEIGAIFDGRVEIKQGLAEGQTVITSNVNQLKENDPIQIVPEQGV